MEARTSLFCLVYASTASELMSESELTRILETARKNNQAKNITGLLLYAEGNFIQILEGERAEVEALYEHIAQDPRHHGATRLMRRHVGQRSFGDWRMGFRSVSVRELNERVPGFTDILHRSETQENMQEQVSKDIWALLMSFREVTRV